MKIECPHCHTQNQIEYAENIKCENCHKNFKGFNFSLKAISKPIVITSVMAGAVAGYGIENMLEQTRYPIEFEYAMIQSCVSGDYHAPREIKKKMHICICALERTMNDVKYDSKNFDNIFKQNLEKCR